MRTLLVTNDFPPRPGGIQRFVHNLAVRRPAGSLVVYASTWDGAAKFDAEQPFEVVRADTGMLLPTPAVARRAAELARAYECDTVWFGAAAPLGLLAAGLRRRAGITRALAQTHGHENDIRIEQFIEDLQGIGSHTGDQVRFIGRVHIA